MLKIVIRMIMRVKILSCNFEHIIIIDCLYTGSLDDVTQYNISKVCILN